MSWDDDADRLNAGINDLCLRMMALRQPAAGDLRRNPRVLHKSEKNVRPSE